jgi:hypothetical protein
MPALLEKPVPIRGGAQVSRYDAVHIPPYVFIGPGEVHWIGQPCRIVRGETKELVVVALACGCEGCVPRSTLRTGAQL